MNNAFYFALFNALSFQIVLGSPMVLYAKTLGASATVLGIVSGMMPLLVIFQIPASSYVTRIGFKRFVYAGWWSRVSMIFFMAMVPLMGFFLNLGAQLSLMLFLLFGFNLSRGISSAAWLPWITTLVPAPVRGRYLAGDQACMNSASGAAFLVAAFMLWGTPTPWRFAVVFAFSAVMGAASLQYLKRIPDVPVPPEPAASQEPVPWLAISSHPPFRKLLWMNVGWSFAYGGMNAFTVSYMRSQAGLTEGMILLVSTTFYLGGLVSLAFGGRLDRLGSRPVLLFAISVWLILALVWLGVAGEWIHPGTALLASLQFCMGFATALFTISNNRLAMSISPAMGRAHFFALFSVVANLTLGMAPVSWGLIIDMFAGLNTRTGGFLWTRYGVFFLGTAVIFGITIGLARRLHEPSAGDVQVLIRDIFLETPQRVWARLWSKM